VQSVRCFAENAHTPGQYGTPLGHGLGFIRPVVGEVHRGRCPCLHHERCRLLEVSCDVIFEALTQLTQ
jgi:hypothetical protein